MGKRKTAASASHNLSAPNPPTSTPTSTSNVDDDYVRLHITPLDASLLSIVVPGSLLPKARNVSYHTITTFPERRYGFVELPGAEAEKLRKKLNGSVLRGVKMKIERARPEAQVAAEAIAEAEAEEPLRKRRKGKEGKSTKRRDAEVMSGVELEGRKVKRGWTAPTTAGGDTDKRKKREAKDKDKKARKEAKSKYTDEAECLFKTKLPPTAATAAAIEEPSSRTKRKNGKDKEVLVHEFEKSTKFPTFLRSAGAKKATTAAGAATTEFVQDKGWVDADGNVVEPAAEGRRTRSQAKAAEPAPKAAAWRKGYKAEEEQDDETSSSGTSSVSESESDSDPDPSSDNASDAVSQTSASAGQGDVTPKAGAAAVATPSKAGRAGTLPSLSVETTKLDADNFAVPAIVVKGGVQPQQRAPDSARPKSSGSAKSLTIKIPPVTPLGGLGQSAKAVHPLEAMYKRPKRRGDAAGPGGESSQDGEAAEGGGGFSFFSSSDAMDEDDGDRTALPGGSQQHHLLFSSQYSSNAPPMTPFSQLDFDSRRQRSAAPTPDTAHPSRSSTFFWGGGPQGSKSRSQSLEQTEEADEDEDEDEGMGGVGLGVGLEGTKAEEGEGETEEHGEAMDEDEDEEGPATRTRSAGGTADAGGEAGDSDFKKWFWDNRGEINRTWKKRRKTAAREKRYRENRARAERAV